jgi:hypothetical protein
VEPKEESKSEAKMPNRITYFAVLLLSRTEDGHFLAEAAIEARNADQARATASRMAGAERGAVDFSKREILSLAMRRTISCRFGEQAL